MPAVDLTWWRYIGRKEIGSGCVPGSEIYETESHSMSSLGAGLFLLHDDALLLSLWSILHSA